ncbi:glycerate kinase [Cutibacterium sp. WCA-380-WT-3A]|uniref:Glycerate kinase n=1 Tax=Cutibacterium porci TaxID=2605781 RepID=A0A7K0J3X3_9ACTN|nr:glycerate kinase [Cutibacterium porci]MSS44626.1 glycerate kinase [Cutibacterium porci]
MRPDPNAPVVVAVDSFKGSLGSGKACRAVERGYLAADPHREVITVPVADGGEGTVEAVLAAGFHAVTVKCHGATGDLADVDYAMRDNHAVIEMATCCGLERADRVSGPPNSRRGLVASSRGLGEVIAAALRKGATDITVGVGGSASTDGGAGMLEALGVRLLDKNLSPISPGAAGLTELSRLDLSGLNRKLSGAKLTVACDVTSPLLGPQGAAAVFGPQKGLDHEGVAVAEAGLTRLADLMEPAIGSAYRDDPGSGAAGGVGWALRCLGAKYRPGAAAVLGWAKAVSRINAAGLVITGEGRLDEQTLLGKLPDTIRKIALDAGVPVWAVCGRCDLPDEKRRAFQRIISLADVEPDPEVSMSRAGALLSQAVEQAVREEFGR